MSELIAWQDGSFTRTDEVTVSAQTHSLSYATSVYEGIRSYGGSVFKLAEHLRRLRRSADLFGHTVGHSDEELAAVCHRLLELNELTDAYLKILVYYDDADVSFMGRGCASRTAVFALPFPSQGADRRYRLATAEWRRPPAACHPYQAKTSSTYALSYLSYRNKPADADDVLFLSTEDRVCESSGSNIFFVAGDSVVTPTTEQALDGITRQTIIDDLLPGRSVQERDVHYAELADFDAAFLCGTAIEIAEVEAVDGVRFPGSPLVAEIVREYGKLVRSS